MSGRFVVTEQSSIFLRSSIGEVIDPFLPGVGRVLVVQLDAEELFFEDCSPHFKLLRRISLGVLSNVVIESVIFELGPLSLLERQHADDERNEKKEQ